MTTEQKNEEIAIFAGWKLCECGSKTRHYKYGDKIWEATNVDKMDFHTSWNSLMPALIKATKEPQITRKATALYVTLTKALLSLDIKATHEALCNFIINTR